MHESLNTITTARYALWRKGQSASHDEYAAARQAVIGNIVSRIPHSKYQPEQMDDAYSVLEKTEIFHIPNPDLLCIWLIG